MADETTTTTVQYLIPSLVEAAVTEAAGRFRTFRNVYAAYARDMTGPGKSGYVNQLPQLTLAARSEATQPSNTAFTPTAKQYSLATYGLHLEPSWESAAYSVGDLTSNIEKALATAWAKLEDGASTGFAGLYAEASTATPDHAIGSATQVLDTAFILSAAILLDAQYAPYPRSLFINHIGYRDLMSDTDAKQWLAATKGNQPYNVGSLDPRRYMGNIYNVDIFKVDDLVSASSMYHCLMVADGAIGIYFRKIATPLSPVASEFNMDIDYKGGTFGWTIDAEVIHDCVSLASGGGSSANNWIVDMGIKTT